MFPVRVATLTYVSLRCSEEKSSRMSRFYKYLAPNGAKAKTLLLHLVESANAT
jgi:hypothetical protein